MDDASEAGDVGPSIKSDVDAATWKALFDKFATILHLNPWSWLEQKDFFAIRVPESPCTAFLHFRGTGSDRELLVVLGEKDEASYLAIAAGIDHPGLRSFEVSTIRAILRDASEISDFERESLRASEVAADADGLVPVFVRYRPGWIPWSLDLNEATAMVSILNQTLGVLLRAETDKSILVRNDPRLFWMRAWNDKGNTWEEKWEKVPSFTDIELQSIPPQQLIKSVNDLPDTWQTAEVDVDVIPRAALTNVSIISTCSGRPLPVGYALAIADASLPADASSAVHASIYYPCGEIDDFWSSVPKFILEAFEALKRRPREISVSSSRIMNLLRPLQTKIHFKLTYHEKLPHCTAIMKGMTDAIDDVIAKVGKGLRKQHET